jgi:hypothetical protein
MDEETRQARELDALENIAAYLEQLRILKEYELGVWIQNVGGNLDVKPSEADTK